MREADVREWEFLEKGNYNNAWVDPGRRAVIKVSWVNADQWIAAAMNTPGRAARVWNQVNTALRALGSAEVVVVHGVPASADQQTFFPPTEGCLVPFVSGLKAQDQHDAAMAEVIIQIYRETGRILLDGCDPRNFVVSSDAVICIDTDLAVLRTLPGRRRGSDASDNFCQDSLENFSRLSAEAPAAGGYWQIYSKKTPISVRTIKTLIRLENLYPEQCINPEHPARRFLTLEGIQAIAPLLGILNPILSERPSIPLEERFPWYSWRDALFELLGSAAQEYETRAQAIVMLLYCQVIDFARYQSIVSDPIQRQVMSCLLHFKTCITPYQAQNLSVQGALYSDIVVSLVQLLLRTEPNSWKDCLSNDIKEAVSLYALTSSYAHLPSASGIADEFNMQIAEPLHITPLPKLFQPTTPGPFPAASDSAEEFPAPSQSFSKS